VRFLTSRASFAFTPENSGEYKINVVSAKNSFSPKLYEGNPGGVLKRIDKESWNPCDVNNPQRKFVIE
jgi:hypothetical protein